MYIVRGAHHTGAPPSDYKASQIVNFTVKWAYREYDVSPPLIALLVDYSAGLS